MYLFIVSERGNRTIYVQTLEYLTLMAFLNI